MLKNFLKKFFIITIELAVITGALWFIAEKKGIKSVNQVVPALEEQMANLQQAAPFPQQSEPQTKAFNWKFKNINYSLDLTLYKSTYDYYRSLPKDFSYVGTLPTDWGSKYYTMFTRINDGDKTISQLADEIKLLGKKHGLVEDQIVDLTLSFVQSIPYDDAKANDILAKSGNAKILYPYEVLWTQSGVCCDKSLLAYVLLRQMGYGSALFIYDANNHMAVAVECPKNYSTYSSGYCYAETTSTGNKIGIIPSIDVESNKTVDLSSYDPAKAQQLNLQELGEVKILLPAEGKQYSGIIETERIANQISSLKKSISTTLAQVQSLKKTLSEQEGDLKDMENDLEKYKDQQNVERYNELVEDFNKLIEKYKKDAKKYNEQVSLYNGYIKKYNSLIKQ